MRRRAAGFTYLAALYAVALLAGGLALASELWHTASMREKEAELLFVGNQYRQAIGRYYLSGPQRQYPRALEDLLRDPRQPGAERFLRKLYRDPLTGAGEWGLVKAPDGGIQGVYSLSPERPFKVSGFKTRDQALEGAASYTDWKFVFAPAGLPATPPAPQPQR